MYAVQRIILLLARLDIATAFAFPTSKKWKIGDLIGITGAHVDSPCLRIKPVLNYQGNGFLQVAYETCGGRLSHT